jgi:hypothetical protein
VPSLRVRRTSKKPCSSNSGKACGHVARPTADQVVVAGVDAAKATQGLVDRGQGSRRHQWPRQVHGAHGVNQRFLDRVVAVQRRGGVDGQRGVGADGVVECSAAVRTALCRAT